MQVKPSNLLQNFRHYEVPFLRRIAELERGGKEIIYFTGGDAALLGYEPPAYTTTALVNAAKKNLTMYPSFSRDLIKRFREAVARREKKVHGTSYDPEDVIWTNGVTHAHDLVYFSLLGRRMSAFFLSLHISVGASMATSALLSWYLPEEGLRKTSGPQTQMTFEPKSQRKPRCS